ncbi:unnamed protein product [Symbiodinium natans]|uniref:Uncharacterized protein n=1 Tax=Symbiodinium natans TaxID=878477 RepID=A0A812LM72_9DINO|nr:unnamed protein product [Symbiodinium natans]
MTQDGSVELRPDSSASKDVYRKLACISIPETGFWRGLELLLMEELWGPTGLHYLHPLWSQTTDMVIHCVPARCTSAELEGFIRARAPSMPLETKITLPSNRDGTNRRCAFVAHHANLRTTVAALWQQRLPSRPGSGPLKLFPACLQEFYRRLGGGPGDAPLWLTGSTRY